VSRIPDEIYSQVWSAGELAAKFTHAAAPAREAALKAAEAALVAGNLDGLADSLRRAVLAYRQPIYAPARRDRKPKGIDGPGVLRLRAALAAVELLRAGCWQQAEGRGRVRHEGERPGDRPERRRRLARVGIPL
jgi:hypothetical protein